MIGIGFIGLGGMGRYQVKSFQQVTGCTIIAGSDPSDAARAEFAKIAPTAAVYPNQAQVLANKKVDAVVIAVPTAFHKDLAVEALRSGRPVLCEKPMARTVTQCREMLDAADKTGKLLMVAHCRRFDADWGAFADVYRSGQLGEKVLWRNVRGGLAPGKWFMDDALSGGPLLDGAIHNQDFANYLFGPAEYAMGNSIKFDPSCTAIDTGNVIIQYRNGCQLLLSWSWAVHAAWLHDCLGPKSTFVFGPNGLEVPTGKGAHSLIEPSGNKKLVPFELKDMYVTQGKHFLDCIAGARCLSSGQEAIKAVAVGEAVLRACREQEIAKVAN